ncbi:tRNA (adenosine(37)-N6)-threonylcarbamoyltransferase complex ATPase subunit type 1 TsaE [Ferruginibacter sp.]
MEVIFKLENIQEAAAKFLSDADSGNVFAFYGEMGAGKTTFIHALCDAMGVQGKVSSPTFSIINQYTTAENKTIYHLDLYRLKDETEAINAGVEDCLYSGNTCFVEWPEKALSIFPENTFKVTITMIDTDTRKVSINL